MTLDGDALLTLGRDLMQDCAADSSPFTNEDATCRPRHPACHHLPIAGMQAADAPCPGCLQACKAQGGDQTASDRDRYFEAWQHLCALSARVRWRSDKFLRSSQAPLTVNCLHSLPTLAAGAPHRAGVALAVLRLGERLHERERGRVRLEAADRAGHGPLAVGRQQRLQAVHNLRACWAARARITQISADFAERQGWPRFIFRFKDVRQALA